MGIRPVVLLSPTPCAGAIHLPVIAPDFLDVVVDLKGRDAIIFTSKQAVYALEKLAPQWKKLPVFSVGSGTSKVVRDRGGRVAYEASRAYGDTLGEEIVQGFADRHFFYPRAAKVVSHLEEILTQAGVDLRSTIIYQTRCQPIDTAQIPPGAAIVFTAPSTVECFLKQSDWREGWVAVAIGDRTAEALTKNAITHHTSPTPALAEAIAFSATIPTCKLP